MGILRKHYTEAPKTIFQQNVEDVDKFTPLSKYTPVFVFLTGFFPKHLRTLRIPQRWVLNILRWLNEGRMPTNNGHRTKLGYDNRDSALVIQQLKGEWETKDHKLVPY